MKAFKPAMMMAVAVALLTAAPAPAASPKKAAGPYSVSYNQVFSEAFRDFWVRTLSQANGVDVPMPKGRPLVYLPVPAPQEWVSDDEGKEIGVAEVTLTVPPGVSILASGFACIGETHEDGKTDPPWAIEWLMPPYGEVTMVLDGKVLVDRMSMAMHTFGPILFEEPIQYAAPTDSGATAAVWVEGIGVTLPQLRPGKHTLTVWSWSAFCPLSGDGKVTTYKIFVVPPGRN